MQPNLAIRKPVDALDIADLAAFPVWSFVESEEPVHGTDETWVKPLGQVIPDNEFSITVAAELKLQSGLSVQGLIWCDTYDELAVHALAVLTEYGRLLFSRNTSERIVKENLAKLSLRWDEVFPIQYETTAPRASTGKCDTGIFNPPEITAA